MRNRVYFSVIYFGYLLYFHKMFYWLDYFFIYSFLVKWVHHPCYTCLIKTLHHSFILFLEIFVGLQNSFYIMKINSFNLRKPKDSHFFKNVLLELLSLQVFWCLHEIPWRYLFCMNKPYYYRTFLLTDWRHMGRNIFDLSWRRSLS